MKFEWIQPHKDYKTYILSFSFGKIDKDSFFGIKPYHVNIFDLECRVKGERVDSKILYRGMIEGGNSKLRSHSLIQSTDIDIIKKWCEDKVIELTKQILYNSILILHSLEAQ